MSFKQKTIYNSHDYVECLTLLGVFWNSEYKEIRSESDLSNDPHNSGHDLFFSCPLSKKA